MPIFTPSKLGIRYQLIHIRFSIPHQDLMSTIIRKTGTVTSNSHLVIFTADKEKFSTKYFSAYEVEFVKKQLKQELKTVSVNQYKRFIFLWVFDKKNKSKSAILEMYRKSGDEMAKRLNALKIKEVVISDDVLNEELLAFAEGMALGNYQFAKFKSNGKKEKNTLSAINLQGRKIKEENIQRLNTVIEATCMARDLVNEPQSSKTATDLAGWFKAFGKKAGFRVQVFDKKKIQSLKMGGLLAVNKGSINPPTFTIMEWKPARAVNKKPYVLVGKGVVYDTGGLSLKPTSNSMDYMKCDMAGGAVVGCTMHAIAKAKLPVHVIGLVPATDNRPDGNAYAPGDVITMLSGKTVEVLNTDAEGRMILADALHWAKKYKPELVMEFSTLTGAAAAAIGRYGIVAMGTASKKIKEQIADCGEQVYERLAEFPFWDEYDELLKSDIADMKNIGGPNAGAITAGRFLYKFTDYPFMHFDIAGPAFDKTADSYRGKNATGIGVRLMFEFFSRRAEENSKLNKQSR